MLRRRTALWEEHEALGGDMGAYSWSGMALPWSYRSDVADEYAAVRRGVGVADASQLRVVELSGRGATAALEALVPVAVGTMPLGTSRFTVFLNRRGRVVDEAIVMRHEADRYWVSHGPGTASELLVAAFPASRPLDGLHALAVQGPRSQGLLERGLDAPLHDLAAMAHRPAHLWGKAATLSRTGFTGELGFEIFGPGDVIVDCWRRLLGAGAVPYAYRTVDLLRVEVGFPVYPVDLAPLGSLWEASLGWLLRGKEHDFVGRLATGGSRAVLTHRLLGVGFPGFPRVPRGTRLRVGGDVVGVVTSSAQSPAAEATLCVARLVTAAAPGTPVTLADGPSQIVGTVQELPFRPRRSREGGSTP